VGGENQKKKTAKKGPRIISKLKKKPRGPSGEREKRGGAVEKGKKDARFDEPPKKNEDGKGKGGDSKQFLLRSKKGDTLKKKRVGGA